MLNKALILFISLFLTACANTEYALKQAEINFKNNHYTQAFKEFLPLAQKGNADAQYAIGYMYYYGKGIHKNRIKARKWIMKAASQNQAQATKAIKYYKP